VSGAALPLVEPESQPSIAASGNKFLLVTVAFRRAVQIRAGARPRVYIESRQPTVIAVAEVTAGCVAYGVADEPEPRGDSR
jgi:DNA-directed RNA polymerase omega subunit